MQTFDTLYLVFVEYMYPGFVTGFVMYLFGWCSSAPLKYAERWWKAN